MTDEEVQMILEEIIELGRSIGFSSAMAQNKDGAILGLYIGEYDWIKAKVGHDDQKITH